MSCYSVLSQAGQKLWKDVKVVKLGVVTGDGITFRGVVLAVQVIPPRCVVVRHRLAASSTGAIRAWLLDQYLA